MSEMISANAEERQVLQEQCQANNLMMINDKL